MDKSWREVFCGPCREEGAELAETTTPPELTSDPTIGNVCCALQVQDALHMERDHLPEGICHNIMTTRTMPVSWCKVRACTPDN